VLEVLASHPDRAKIIEAEPKMSKRRAEVHRVLKSSPQRDAILSENPKLTCTKEARKLADKYDGFAANRQESGDKYRPWFNKVIKLANEVTREAAVADQDLTKEQTYNLLMVVEPSLLEGVRKAGKALVKLADRLDSLFDDADALKELPATANEPTVPVLQ
jgi:hypothetical protein